MLFVVGTQKNHLNETVRTQNICKTLWVRKYLQFYAEKFCLTKPMKVKQIEKRKALARNKCILSGRGKYFNCIEVLNGFIEFKACLIGPVKDKNCV